MTRVAFLGSPEAAVPCLQALVDAGHDVALVVTGPDKRRGRGSTTSATPVKQLALQHGIDATEQPDDILRSGAELGVVVAYGRLVRPPLLGCLLFVNIHFSLLPRWRGAAPVERAILAGDERTGVCLMQLEEGLDTGPVYACADTAILPGATADSLRQQLAVLGAELLVSRLSGGIASLGTPVPQAGEPTYAAKITAQDLHIDWTGSALAIERQVRVGKAWTTLRGSRVIIWAAVAVPERPVTPAPGTVVDGCVATGDGWLRLDRVQPEGRAQQAAADWLRGARMTAADAFS
jgi:methionyl-tRNA formyltransferase